MKTFELVINNSTNSVELIIKEDGTTISKFNGAIKRLALSKDNRTSVFIGNVEKTIQISHIKISHIKKGDGLMITKNKE